MITHRMAKRTGEAEPVLEAIERNVGSRPELCERGADFNGGTHGIWLRYQERSGSFEAGGEIGDGCRTESTSEGKPRVVRLCRGPWILAGDEFKGSDLLRRPRVPERQPILRAKWRVYATACVVSVDRLRR